MALAQTPSLHCSYKACDSQVGWVQRDALLSFPKVHDLCGKSFCGTRGQLLLFLFVLLSLSLACSFCFVLSSLWPSLLFNKQLYMSTLPAAVFASGACLALRRRWLRKNLFWLSQCANQLRSHLQNCFQAVHKPMLKIEQRSCAFGSGAKKVWLQGYKDRPKVEKYWNRGPLFFHSQMSDVTCGSWRRSNVSLQSKAPVRCWRTFNKIQK